MADDESRLVCIDESRVCDFHYDCYDGRDERRCGPCDFEDNDDNDEQEEDSMCGWASPAWQRVQAVDHTLASSNSFGHFVTVKEEQQEAARSKEATLTSPELPVSGEACELSFFYFANGTRELAQLDLYTAENGSDPAAAAAREHLWYTQVAANHTGDWVRASVSVGRHSRSGWRVLFVQQQQMSSGNGGIALDDISFVNCHPEDAADRTRALARCDFESNSSSIDEVLCGWRTEARDESDWRRFMSGPIAGRAFFGDHTSASGHYLAVSNGLKKAAEGASGVLSSSLFTPTSAKSDNCLSFWYHQYGGAGDELSVWMRTRARTRLVWRRSGRQANEWLNARVQLSSGVPFRLAVEAALNASSSLLLGIDDVAVTRGPCALSRCDFEDDDWCSLMRDTQQPGYLGWQRGTRANSSSKDTTTAMMATMMDHTLGSVDNPTGHYLFVERGMRTAAAAAAANEGDTFLVETSQQFNDDALGCVRFWYLMSGYQVGSLRLLKMRDDQGNDNKKGGTLYSYLMSSQSKSIKKQTIVVFAKQ